MSRFRFSRPRLVGFAALAVAVAVTGPAAAGAQARKIHGTVVHRNARAHSFAVVDRHGRVAAIHARTLPRPGSTVVVSGRRLANGTYAASKVRVLHRRRHAKVRVHGTVSFVDRRRGTFTLSGRGFSMVIRARRGRVRAADALPPVGTVVTATGTTDDAGDLEETSVSNEGTDTDGFNVEGKLLAVDPTARTVTVSSDDEDSTGSSIVVHVPATLDMSKFAVGQEVEFEVIQQPDGSFLATGADLDDNATEADDPADTEGVQGDDDSQGDEIDAGEAPEPGDSGGSGGSGD